jgi:eukaryotic-like serine/threonine-protein kinase
MNGGEPGLAPGSDPDGQTSSGSHPVPRLWSATPATPPPHPLTDAARASAEAPAGQGQVARQRWGVPGYAAVKILGEGGFGEVVLARHEESRTLVAIKYLHQSLLSDPEFARLFRAEARVLASLDDPNIVRLYEYVESATGAAIVMELIDGVSVREILSRQGATTAEAALVVLHGSLLGLAAAHARGVVHRDYKPENVLVDGHGASKLTDFGIAARAGDRPVPAGTLAYAPPEQFAGSPASPAADVYAATATFYECLTGHPPFTGESVERMLYQHLHEPVPLEAVPEPLRPLLAAGMAKDPADRPADAAAFAAELRTVAWGAYGQDWEDRGRSNLGEAALLLAALWPSGAAPAVHGSAAEKLSLSRHPGPSRESRHLRHLRHLRHERHEEHLAHLRRVRRLRVAVAVAVAAVVAAGVALAVTRGSPHRPGGANAPVTASSARPTPSRTPAKWQRVRTLTDPTAGEIQAMAISPTGGLLATGGFDGSSYLWNMASGQLVATITQPSSDGVESLAFSPDGKTLAIGFGSGTIVLWDVATMQTVATLSDGYGQGGVSSLAFSPDGSTLAAADLGSRGTFLWDVATGRQLALLSARLGAITATAFSPDGKTLAMGGDGGTILWDVATGAQIARFGISASGPIISVAFSPDGRMLATGGFEGAVLWDVATGRQVAFLANPVSLPDATSVAFSPDGADLATAGVHTLVWATATGAKITTIPIVAGVVAFSPQGQMLATTTGNRVVVWAQAG